MKTRLLLTICLASLAGGIHGPAFAMTADAGSAASWMSASVNYDKLPAVEAAKIQNRTYYNGEQLLQAVTTGIGRSLEALISRDLNPPGSSKSTETSKEVSAN